MRVARCLLVMGILILGLTLGMTCRRNPSPLSFATTFGESGWDAGSSARQTSDGGYIITGYTDSHGAGSGDVWLVKTDARGDRDWDKTFGGTRQDGGNSVRQTSDGGYVIAGSTESYGAGGRDVWLVKTDASGDRVWDRAFGGSGYDEGYSVEQTSDGGYIVTGCTESYGAGIEDVWLIKIDAQGNKVWDKTLGGTDWEAGYSAQQTSDGGYIVVGVAHSSDAGGRNGWLVRTDSSGNSVWGVILGGAGDDQGNSVQQTTDGGYIVAGYTTSSGAGGSDVWLVRTDTSGNEVWARTFGGADDDVGMSVRQSSDGGYIVAGCTMSSGAGGSDVWLVKTDASGNRVWDRKYGGTGDDFGESVWQTSDGGYVVAGYTSPRGIGNADVLLIKTDAEGN